MLYASRFYLPGTKYKILPGTVVVCTSKFENMNETEAVRSKINLKVIPFLRAWCDSSLIRHLFEIYTIYILFTYEAYIYYYYSSFYSQLVHDFTSKYLVSKYRIVLSFFLRRCRMARTSHTPPSPQDCHGVSIRNNTRTMNISWNYIPGKCFCRLSSR